jgi:hypothetical protein
LRDAVEEAAAAEIAEEDEESAGAVHAEGEVPDDDTQHPHCRWEIEDGGSCGYLD